ncbi:MAG: hypothetical protein AB1422_18950 [bacterium]
MIIAYSVAVQIVIHRRDARISREDMEIHRTCLPNVQQASQIC